MAIEKPLQLSSGFAPSYWRVTALEVNFDQAIATVHYAVYKDKAHRDSGGTPTRRSLTAVTGKEFVKFFPRESKDTPLALAYNCLIAKVPVLREAPKA